MGWLDDCISNLAQLLAAFDSDAELFFHSELLLLMLNEEMSDFFVCVYLLTVMFIIYIIIIVKVSRGSACVLLVNPYILFKISFLV